MTSDAASRRAGLRPVTGTSARPRKQQIAAVLVVKNLGDAKTRLAASLLRPDVGRDALRELVLAMLLDTLAAVSDAGLDPIVVVSPDDEVLRVVTSVGFHALRETPRPGATLNHAYAQGAHWVRDHHHQTGAVMMVQADLPAANPLSIVEVIAAAPNRAAALISDEAGTGTAILLSPVTHTDLPRFGPDSAAAHRHAGATELDPAHLRWPDLRNDVDTADDLARATLLGVGTHTRSVLAHNRAILIPDDGAAAPRPADAS